MPLQMISASKDLLSLYSQALLDVTGSQCDESKVCHIPCGTLFEEDLLAGAGLEAVVVRGCRVLYLGNWASDGDAKSPVSITICEIPNATDKMAASLHSFAQGDLAALIYQRINEVQKLAHLKKNAYDLHFLTVPEIQFQALHLVSRCSAEDMVVPVLSGDPRLSIGAVLKASEFLAIARTIATARAKRRRSHLSS